MIVSPARIEANKRNAARSSGPKTEAGKARSRMNAIQHGLASEVVRQPDELAALAAIPVVEGSFDRWLVEEVALITGRLTRADEIGIALREKAVLRAGLAWDEDRRVEAESLGAQIGKRPSAVVQGLKATLHGSQWLLDRWAMLARVADWEGGWEDEHKRMAFDLLGIPVELRGSHPGVSIDAAGNAVGDLLQPVALARRESESLQAHIERITPLDALARDQAEADLVDEPSAEYRKLRRHEADLHRRLRWCLAQIESGTALPASEIPAPVEPEAAPEPSPEPSETPEVAPTPVPVDPPSRRERKEARVEARREAKQRKLERIRA